MAIIKLWEKESEKTFNVKKYCLNKNKVNTSNSSIELNNKTFQVTEIKTENKNIFLKINNQQYKVKILKQDKNNIEIYIFNFNKSFSFSLKQPIKIKAAKLIKDDNSFNQELTSPLAGRVVNVHVKENDFIKKNQVLVTIESMKMENELRASSDCFIKTIQISHSDLVQPNQVLMRFTKKGESCAKSKNKYEPKKVPNRGTC